MNYRTSRRTVVRGAAGLSIAAVVTAFPGARVVRGQGESTYDLIDLGAWELEVDFEKTLGWSGYGYVNDLNDDGTICGGIAVSDERGSPATWSSAGKLKRLKSSKGGGLANAINGEGDVVGVEYVEQGITRPMLWRGGERVELSLLDDEPDLTVGFAADISDSGVIVGRIGDERAETQYPVRWIEGVAERLPALDGRQALSAAFINRDDVILGLAASDGTEETHACILWHDGEPTLVTMPEEVSIEMTPFVRGLTNNGGILVAVVDRSDNRRWFSLFIDGDKATIIDRRDDGRSFVANDVNDNGAIVGRLYGPDPDDPNIGVIWRDDELVDLNDEIPADADLQLFNVESINSVGMIAGLARDADGVTHGVLLMPRA